MYHNSPRYIRTRISSAPLKSVSKTRKKSYYLHIICTESFSLPSPKACMEKKKPKRNWLCFCLYTKIFDVPCSFFGLYTNILYKYGKNSCSFTYLNFVNCEIKWRVIHEIIKNLCLIYIYLVGKVWIFRGELRYIFSICPLKNLTNIELKKCCYDKMSCTNFDMWKCYVKILLYKNVCTNVFMYMCCYVIMLSCVIQVVWVWAVLCWIRDGYV